MLKKFDIPLAETYFVGDHQDLFAEVALHDGAGLVTDADHVDVGVGGELSTDCTDNTGVDGSAQT